MSKTLTTAGAAEFQNLLAQIGALSNATAGTDGHDGRDYRAITALIEASLISQYVSALPDRREGYLRAMADMLCMVADGVLPGEDWDPLRIPNWPSVGRQHERRTDQRGRRQAVDA